MTRGLMDRESAGRSAHAALGPPSQQPASRLADRDRGRGPPLDPRRREDLMPRLELKELDTPAR
jgi:hypothetical protein